MKTHIRGLHRLPTFTNFSVIVRAEFGWPAAPLRSFKAMSYRHALACVDRDVSLSRSPHAEPRGLVYSSADLWRSKQKPKEVQLLP